MSNCTEQSFLNDVATHEMNVLRDDGVNRHVRFGRPGSSVYRFDLVTWPGYLRYSGDMGCYVFSRLDDMFEFFRTDRRDGGTLGINLGYWSEKLQAINSHGRSGGSVTEFDEDRFRAVINEYRIEWVRENRHMTTKEDRRDLWDEIDSDVLGELDNGEHAAMLAAHRFSYNAFEFTDLFEHNFERFTYHFIWCCYALAWGIMKYDDAKGGEA